MILNGTYRGGPKKESLLNYLAWKNPTIYVSQRENDEIYAGAIIHKEEQYPIYEGLPFFLSHTARKKSEKIQKTYDELSPCKWNVTKNDFMKHLRRYHLRKIKAVLSSFPSSKAINVLSIGAGYGWELFVARKLQKLATGIALDVASKPLNLGKTLAKRLTIENFHFCVGRAEELPFRPNMFDVVFGLFGVLDHSKEYQKIFKEVQNVLAPGGYTFLTGLNKFSSRWILSLLKDPVGLFKKMFENPPRFSKTTLPLEEDGHVRIPTHFFTRFEFNKLVAGNGLQIRDKSSIFSLIPVPFTAKTFNPLQKRFAYLDLFGNNVPLLDFLGRYLGIIAKKPGPS